MNIFDWIFYNICKTIVFITMNLLCRVKIINNKVLPPHNEPVLLVGNHTSWIDTLMISCATFRHTWFLTGDFILDVPIMRDIVQHLYILPMRRKHGKEGMELAINKLKEKRPVCIFPEGEITPTGEMLRFRNGVSIIQKAANAPIIPFYIKGGLETWSIVQPKWKFFTKMSITFGEPFYPQNTKDNEISQEIQEQVVKLK